VALGEDAHAYVTSALQQRIACYENDRPWTATTAFETANAR
jgi:hypothetical protein